MKKPTLSIVITAHHEGIIAHKTILSVLAGLEKIDETYEIIINLDAPDHETTKYFARYKKNPHFILNTTNFGEPSSARNAGIKLARGKYITVLDGDDLLSDNFFSEFFELAAKHKNQKIIVHPGATMQFGEDIPLTAWPQFSSTDQPSMTFSIVGVNAWSQSATGSAEIFHKIPYAPATKGFGYEDWWWNSETLVNGYKHYVTDTVLFYRKKTEGSVFASHESNHTVVAYTKLLSTARVKTLPLPPLARNLPPITSRGKKLIKKSIKFAYKIAIALPIIKIPVLHMARKVEKRVADKRFDLIPEYLRASWQSISKIEPLIKYSRAAAEHICFQYYGDDYIGIVYRHIVEHITSDKPVDRLYMVSSRMSSLAKKTIENSIRRDIKRHPKWHIVVLADFGIKIKGVDFIKFGELTRQLNGYEKDRMFSRLIIQLQVKDLVVADSEFFLRWVKDHAKLLSSNDYNITAMIFQSSFADPLLVGIYPLCAKIMTSNKKVIDILVNQQAFDPNKIKAIDDAAEN